MSLAARPQRQGAVTVPLRRRTVGLDIALVDGRSKRLLLHNDLGCLPALRDIPQTKLKVVRQVRAGGGVIVVQYAARTTWSGLRSEPFVQ